MVIRMQPLALMGVVFAGVTALGMPTADSSVATFMAPIEDCNSDRLVFRRDVSNPAGARSTLTVCRRPDDLKSRYDRIVRQLGDAGFNVERISSQPTQAFVTAAKGALQVRVFLSQPAAAEPLVEIVDEIRP